MKAARTPKNSGAVRRAKPSKIASRGRNQKISAKATPELHTQDHAANRQRLTELLPAAGAALAPQWPDGRARAWAGVRATLPDRLPAVGAWRGRARDGFEPNRAAAPADSAQAAIDSIPADILPIHLCTGLGARGLTLAVLCGELLAATLHGEPLPLARSLARRLRARRFASAPASPAGRTDPRHPS